MATEEGPARPDLMGELRFKIPLPIVIPFASLLLIAALAIGFSRVLLSLPKEAATIVATATAANVLAGCAYVAYRRRMSQTTWIELVAVVVYPVVIAVAIAQIGFGEGAEEAHGGEKPAAGEGITTSITAEGVAFTTGTITLPAGEEVEVEFVNNDTGTLHNVAIYESEADAGSVQKNPIFDGEEFPGVATRTYAIEIPKPGEYFFQCDVHPNMNGKVVAE